MAGDGVYPRELRGWLAARSLARGLPAPVDDHGGFRVDTGSAVEAARWVFAKVVPGLGDLVAAIRAPGHPVKLCGTPAQLRAVLPEGWALQRPAHFMRATGAPPVRNLPEGYRVTIETVATKGGAVSTARILSPTGALAARGHAAETDGVFVYDRIATEPVHRRKGLGHVLIQTLHAARREAGATGLLVATDAGRALYATLGWEVLSPYVTGEWER